MKRKILIDGSERRLKRGSQPGHDGSEGSGNDGAKEGTNVDDDSDEAFDSDGFLKPSYGHGLVGWASDKDPDEVECCCHCHQNVYKHKVGEVQDGREKTKSHGREKSKSHGIYRKK